MANIARHVIANEYSLADESVRLTDSHEGTPHSDDPRTRLEDGVREDGVREDSPGSTSSGQEPCDPTVVCTCTCSLHSAALVLYGFLSLYLCQSLCLSLCLSYLSFSLCLPLSLTHLLLRATQRAMWVLPWMPLLRNPVERIQQAMKAQNTIWQSMPTPQTISSYRE